jgi:hypothetical protein
MSEKASTVRVHFPNEYFHDNVPLVFIREFKYDQCIRDEVFGWWGKLYISMPLSDYNRLQEFKNKKK